MNLRPLLLLITFASLRCASATDMHRAYDDRYAAQLVPLLRQAIGHQTLEGNTAATLAQKEWLIERAREFGFTTFDAGSMLEIDLPATRPGAPVLGLVVHGDVTAATPAGWSAPPFELTERNGFVFGRGVADDKGPMIQAMLAMKVLRDQGGQRAATVRLLVGTDEESTSEDVAKYLKVRKPPDASVVLDSMFPLIVGEKAWDGLEVTAPPLSPQSDARGVRVESLEAGLAPSIVPDNARLQLRGDGNALGDIERELRRRTPAEGITLDFDRGEDRLTITARGFAAHAGVNVEAGRNALVGLANLIVDLLPAGPARDLLAFARMAGADFGGAGLELTESDPIWGKNVVNVGTIKPMPDGRLQLTINIRRIPGRTAPQMKEHLAGVVAKFNQQNGSALQSGGYFEDEPFGIALDSPGVKQLLAVYERTTGTRAVPIVSGGGTYAKRLPNSIAFGMWFPGAPYTGHDVDERISIRDLHRGTHVLIELLDELVLRGAKLPQFRRAP